MQILDRDLKVLNASIEGALPGAIHVTPLWEELGEL